MIGRALPAALLAAAALVVTLAGALAAGPSGGAVARWFEVASSDLSAILGGAGTALPFGYAFAAGMLAAVNPCGFVLVPAYLGSYLGVDAGAGRSRLLLRALGFSGTVTAGFVVLFGAAGLVLGGLGRSVVLALPWLGLGVGVLLVVAGAVAVAGGSAPSLAAGEHLAARLARVAARPGLPGYAAYGAAYGLASLGCALPVFLTVVGGALTQGFVGAVGLLLLYGLGLGAVLSAAAVLAATLGTGVVAHLGRSRRWVAPVGAVLLLLAGAYVTYYWLTAGGILARVVA